MKVDLCDLHAVCICVSPTINFQMAEPIFMKLGLYMMASEATSTAYITSSSHQSLCLYVYSPLVARQRLGKKSPIVARQRIDKNEYTGNNIRIVVSFVFYAVRVV
jgi:hypothetical protein